MAKRQIDFKKYEGKCIGIADGKVVVQSKSVDKVMNTLIKKYSNSEISIASVPRGDKIFVL